MASPKTGRKGIAQRALIREYKAIQMNPVEGFNVKLNNEENLYEWEVALFGPPETIYEGGYYKAVMKFPPDYPYSPPSVRFLTKLWHPNVYPNGALCISILHPPVDDPRSGELPCERWNPTQTVRTILLSVVSLLNEPNVSSPANVDASVMYRRWKESKGKDRRYEDIVRRQAADSGTMAAKEGIIVPRTLEEYCCKTAAKKDEMMEEADYYRDSDEDDVDEYESEDSQHCLDKSTVSQRTSPPVGRRQDGTGRS